MCIVLELSLYHLWINLNNFIFPADPVVIFNWSHDYLMCHGYFELISWLFYVKWYAFLFYRYCLLQKKQLPRTRPVPINPALIPHLSESWYLTKPPPTGVILSSSCPRLPSQSLAVQVWCVHHFVNIKCWQTLAHNPSILVDDRSRFLWYIYQIFFFTKYFTLMWFCKVIYTSVLSEIKS